MRKRSTEILEKLILSNSKSMEVKKLITTYRISLKTLRTDVNEINDFLLEAKMSPMYVILTVPANTEEFHLILLSCSFQRLLYS